MKELIFVVALAIAIQSDPHSALAPHLPLALWSCPGPASISKGVVSVMTPAYLSFHSCLLYGLLL